MYSNAIYYFKKALEINNTQLDAFRDLAICFYETQEYVKAILYFKKFLLTNKRITNEERADIYSWLSDSYLHLKQYYKSIEIIEIALKSYPQNEQYLYILGIANYYEKNINESIITFRKLIGINSCNYKYWNWLGNNHAYCGVKPIPTYTNCMHKNMSINRDEAIICYKKSFEILVSEYKQEKINHLVEVMNILITLVIERGGENIILADKILNRVRTNLDRCANEKLLYAYFFNKAKVCFAKEEYDKSIEYYGKCLSDIENLNLISIFECLVVLDKYESGDLEKLIIAALEYENVEFARESKYFYAASNIIDNTSDIKVDKGKIRIELIKLFIVICEIKSLLKVEYSGIKGTNIFHYTSVNTLKFLINNSEQRFNYLRMSNVAYLNDPSEGKTFDLFLQVKYGYSQFNFNSDKYSNTYLLSFSNAYDKLPLWNQYADKAQGCCIGIDSCYFDAEDQDFSYSNAISVYDEKANFSDEYCLYYVVYLDKKFEATASKFANINGILNKLVKILNRIDEFKCLNCEELVRGMLDSIRFLFKSSDYEYEEEVRVVKFPNSNEIMNEIGNYRVPHLFIEMSREFKIKQITFGPKTLNISEIIPFVKLHNSEIDIKTSEISFR